MTTASELSELATLSEVDVAAICYLAASEGDVDQTLIWAVQDLLRAEHELVEARRAISHGYVRAGTTRTSSASV